jgi:hypothetical protein
VPRRFMVFFSSGCVSNHKASPAALLERSTSNCGILQKRHWQRSTQTRLHHAQRVAEIVDHMTTLASGTWASSQRST